MPELEWLELARTDLLGIVDYISDDNPDAAQRVKDDVEMKAKKLSEFPKIGRPGRVEGTRELIAWSNYILVYHTGANSAFTNSDDISSYTPLWMPNQV